MKKYTLGLLAVALAVCASAFSSPPEKNQTMSELYWFNPGNTIQSISTVHFATLADEKNNVCPGSGVACKDGYTAVTDLGDGRYQAKGAATPIQKQ